MGSLGLPEIAFIFILALLIFGPKKLPEIGRTVGRGVAEFRKATTELKRSINTELALEEIPTPAALKRNWLEELTASPQAAEPSPPADQKPEPATAADPEGAAPDAVEPESR